MDEQLDMFEVGVLLIGVVIVTVGASVTQRSVGPILVLVSIVIITMLLLLKMEDWA